MHGAVLVSTGKGSLYWQVGGTRYEQPKINGNKIKNAFASVANMFKGTSAVAFA